MNFYHSRMLQSLSRTENTYPSFGMRTDKANGLFKGRCNGQRRMGPMIAAPLVVVFVIRSGLAILVLTALIV